MAIHDMHRPQWQAEGPGIRTGAEPGWWQEASSILWAFLKTQKETRSVGENRHQMMVPKHNKGCLWKALSQYYTEWWGGGVWILEWNRMSMSSNIIHYSTWSFSQENKANKRKRISSRGRKSQAVPNCKWYNSILRKPWRHHRAGAMAEW